MKVVFASARSSPGVTTTVMACASVWPGRTLLVEASEDGGAIAARFGLPLEPGATTLAAATRHEGSADALDGHVQPLPGTDGRMVALVGPPAAESAQTLWRAAAGTISRFLDAADDRDILVDAGRLTPAPTTAPLLTSADRVVLVARPRVEELQALAQRLAPVAEMSGQQPDLVLVGDRPYGPEEVGRTLGCDVLGVVADDRRAAEALGGTGSSRRLVRSPLLRTAATVVDVLTTRRRQHRPATAGPPTATAAGATWTSTAPSTPR